MLAAKDARIKELEEQVKDGVTYGMLMKSREMVSDLQAENDSLQVPANALFGKMLGLADLFDSMADGAHAVGDEKNETMLRLNANSVRDKLCEWAQKQANQGTN